jgi:hypothetical protein
MVVGENDGVAHCPAPIDKLLQAADIFQILLPFGPAAVAGQVVELIIPIGPQTSGWVTEEDSHRSPAALVVEIYSPGKKVRFYLGENGSLLKQQTN